MLKYLMLHYLPLNYLMLYNVEATLIDDAL